MSRPDHHSQRSEAIRLARQHFRPGEIRGRLTQPRPSARTIRRWLETARESGELPSREQIVAQLLAEGMKKAQIGRELRMSRGQVHNIARKLDETDPEDLDFDGQVRKFLANPERYLEAEFTESEVFGGRLLQIGLEIMDRNAAKGSQIAEPIERLFEHLRLTQAEPAARLATCRMLQARGMRSGCLSSRGEHRLATEILQEVEFVALSGRCAGCAADYARRRALAAGLWAYSGFVPMWTDALKWIDRARHIYGKTRGHDLLGNGPAHCQHTFAFILLFSGRPASAAALEVERGVAVIDAATSAKLKGLLANLMAFTQKDSTCRHTLRRARDTLDIALESLVGEVSEAETALYWCAGYLEARLEDTEASVQSFARALEASRGQRLEADASAILADVGLVFPNPREIRAQIEGMALDHEPDLFPQWIRQPLHGGIRKLWGATSSGATAIVESAASLRQQAQAAGEATGRIFIPAPR